MRRDRQQEGMQAHLQTKECGWCVSLGSRGADKLNRPQRFIDLA